MLSSEMPLDTPLRKHSLEPDIYLVAMRWRWYQWLWYIEISLMPVRDWQMSGCKPSHHTGSILHQVVAPETSVHRIDPCASEMQTRIFLSHRTESSHAVISAALVYCQSTSANEIRTNR
jgi:hypothetical protein